MRNSSISHLHSNSSYRDSHLLAIPLIPSTFTALDWQFQFLLSESLTVNHRGYIVPRASHHDVTIIARLGRKQLAEQLVSSGINPSETVHPTTSCRTKKSVSRPRSTSLRVPRLAFQVALIQTSFLAYNAVAQTAKFLLET